MQVMIDLQNMTDSEQIPSAEDFESWVRTALELEGSQLEQPELTIRVVSAEESQQLNHDYRDKDKPTNILSFPFEAPEMLPKDALAELLGDLVICETVMKAEALQQNKLESSHWAHLVVHGVLHLLGHDHMEPEQADAMESLEIAILKKLGIDDPYVEV
jgi:probable rRNA maturation factor